MDELEVEDDHSYEVVLNLRSLLRTTLGKAIDLPAYSCVETLVRALSHQDMETHSTKGFTAVPDNSNSTVRPRVYKYDPCHSNVINNIHYSFPVHPTQHPKSPSLAPAYSTLPGQTIPYLSLASLPIPFLPDYSVISL